MNVVIDVEGNGLKPTKIWVIVCREVDSGAVHIFREPSDNETEKLRFLVYARMVDRWIGHNCLDYDLPSLASLLGLDWHVDRVDDTLVVSKLVDYSRPNGHSLEAYGEEFGIDKSKFTDWSKYSKELEDRCISDTEINLKVYLKYLRIINDTSWHTSLRMEHEFQLVVNSLSNNGFSFNVDKCTKLLHKVTNELSTLDQEIAKAFPSKLKLIREVTPKETKHGTISLSSIPLAVRRAEAGDLSAYSVDAPFSYCSWVDFNPSSHTQLIEVLNTAGWRPVDKTQTHIDTERELSRTKYQKHRSAELDLRIQELYNKINNGKRPLKDYGWKINENNLSTLPDTAPKPATYLAQRILLESRRRTLTEWLALVQQDSRIHGKFFGIGAWTHRMAHQNPNTANIPNEFDTAGKVKLYGKEMRALWVAPRNRLLVGVDAEGIQLRIFAHYIDDEEFTRALVTGQKHDKTDPHSLNQRILGSVCKSRAAAKRFIFALLLGAGIGKLAEILGCSEPEAKEALDNLIERYKGFADLKGTIIPRDAKRGWFEGLDGRKVKIPGETDGARKHLAMSGYLQNGEAVCMKRATLKWEHKLQDYKALLVNFVHDEWQTECPNNVDIALKIAKIQADSLREVGEELNLKCPLAGSYWNDDLKDYTIGTNWKVTH